MYVKLLAGSQSRLLRAAIKLILPTVEACLSTHMLIKSTASLQIYIRQSEAVVFAMVEFSRSSEI
ncbi:MAG: hypothetical protein KME54_16050 [Tolypothrix brevis GSE-NOS-MK-07-07A]|jgi:hypothetical protein|nr:hypothetical protein [Tolypothrix brevis GSE-NOS-MK-07-07A]